MDRDEFLNMLDYANQTLPGTWSPRRTQPEYDRYFTGKQDITTQFNAATDKAQTWTREALAFSDLIKSGFEGGGDDGLTLADFGANARAFVKLGKNQGLDDDQDIDLGGESEA